MSRRLLLALSALLCFALAGGCDPAPSFEPCTSNDECPDDHVCSDGECTPRADVDGGTDRDGGSGRDAGPPAGLESIALDPATADLVSVDGSMPEQTFAVIGTFSDGTTRPLAGPSFTIDPVGVGTIDVASGRFVANGIIGGTATVTAAVPNPAGGELEATGTVSVRLERTLLGDGVPADVADRFAGTPVTDDTRRAQIVYPLDGVVMPQNVYPADLQWLRGASGDLFRVTLEKPSITVTAYLAHDGSPGNHWLVEQAAWRSLAQTDPGSDASITVDRFEAATSEVVAGTPVRVHFARAALTGSVYYWDIERGRIVRIDDGTATRDEFMPSPPLDYTSGSRCVGCHAVSNSGRYMAGRLGGGENIGAVFDLTADLSGDPPPVVFPLDRGGGSLSGTSVRWWFASWSPDDTRMVVTQQEGAGPNQMAIYDPYAGTQMGVAGSLPSNVTHPAWAPDNSQIAYIANLGTNEWGGNNVQGDVAVIDVLGPDTFGSTRVLHSGASLAGDVPGGNADSYPTWSPDSRFIAFAHGTGSRSEDQQSALYVMNRDGTDVVRMDGACGVEGRLEFQPRFSPFEQGGYYWMSFLSRRDYGNADVGTRGTQRQQIWVTAVRSDAAPGEDPSSVPYWLPGQNTTSRNISAYWAPRPCRPDGESCTVGSECCGGDCRPDESGALVCSPPPPDRCRMVNETCSTDEDCCDGLSCIGNVCVRAPE
ncbi:MAG TPA: hypothetical protein RMH99_23540 [Sandaracinaceae bacterium LLY-WYZ-13_1]|nr:hypothetical protein [Sandaracinaceae bacterium LLY-WYZ-13_1]